MRAGEFPGEAPQKTHILTMGEEEMLFFRAESGCRFSFEGPDIERSALVIEGAGEAPPDAILL